MKKISVFVFSLILSSTALAGVCNIKYQFSGNQKPEWLLKDKPWAVIDEEVIFSNMNLSQCIDLATLKFQQDRQLKKESADWGYFEVNRIMFLGSYVSGEISANFSVDMVGRVTPLCRASVPHKNRSGLVNSIAGELFSTEDISIMAVEYKIIDAKGCLAESLKPYTELIREARQNGDSRQPRLHVEFLKNKVKIKTDIYHSPDKTPMAIQSDILENL